MQNIKLQTLRPDALNNTRKDRSGVIFFTRCAKVGSESMIELFHLLEVHNRLHIEHSGLMKRPKRQMKPAQQRRQAKYIHHLAPGSVYIEHTNWVNFTAFGLPKPIYINMVRDPVERVISWYFYERNSFKNAMEYRRFPNKPTRSPAWYKKNFSECVRSGDPECQYIPYSVKDFNGNYKRQSLFFCGHKMDCLPFDSPVAIQIAKQHVESEYAVVGTWEETNITLQVLEAYIPRFFKGATAIFNMNRQKITNRNKNKRKPYIADDIKQMIRKNFTNEYDFYYFCRQRLYKQYIALKMLESLSAHLLNNTRHADLEVLFFNRVTKVGSESLMELLQRLAKASHIKVLTKGPLDITTRTRTPRQQIFQSKWVANLASGTAYIEHCNWLNFSHFELPKPIYINLVRDPVERMISWYFYVRGSYKNAIFYNKYPDADIRPVSWFKKDFNQCVRSGDPECQYIPYTIFDDEGNHKRQSLFFCGHNQECLPFDSPLAIQIAKRNVERDYAVVGSLEDTNVTLTVLEKYIPRFFSGAFATFNSHNQQLRNRNRNRRKPKIDADVKELMRRNFTHEYEFYYFCKQRLYKQYLALKLHSNGIH